MSLMLFLVVGMVTAQTDKKAAEIKKLEAGLNIAKANVAKQEKAIALSDSLVEKGTEQVNESKAETKAIATERKALDKEHATQAKALGKLISSKDKEEATQAKADLKAMEIKYKADAKALDTRLKDATKKSTTGTSNVSKGKSGKKTATDALKTAQASLDAAQEKYDVATGAGEPADEGKKKKK
jgi:K+/H+ antiporter YhaU regulatory subunit KhtT